MIDLHTHTMYEVDDGSDSKETSYKMLYNAKIEGTDILCITPHFSTSLKEEYDEKFQKLKAFADAINLQIVKGCEYHFSDLSIEEKNQYMTINDNGYILVDFSSSFIPPNVVDVFFDLEVKSYKILLAHPERLFNQTNIEKMFELLEKGVYFQINAPSLLGYYGSSVKLFAHELIECGLCNAIASDSHNLNTRKFYMNRCFNYIADYYDEDLANLLFYENPLRVLNGESLVNLEDEYEKGFLKKLLRKNFKIY